MKKLIDCFNDVRFIGKDGYGVSVAIGDNYYGFAEWIDENTARIYIKDNFYMFTRSDMNK